MRKLFLIAIVFSLVSCADSKWNKDELVNSCLKEVNNAPDLDKVLSTVQKGIYCDCMANKLLAKYKSARESNKDEAGSTIIAKECVLDVMSK